MAAAMRMPTYMMICQPRKRMTAQRRVAQPFQGDLSAGGRGGGVRAGDDGAWLGVSGMGGWWERSTFKIEGSMLNFWDLVEMEMRKSGGTLGRVSLRGKNGWRF